MAVNMREKYESLSLAVLRDIAKNRGIKSTSTMRKEAVIDAMLAEEGSNLSQGQRQLLSIARIMLSNPPMLILDEATSSIDTRTELQIQKAFDEMMKGRTTFIVAHRLSTIKNADQIIVMDQGHIVEIGNHEELLQKQGYYHQLYYSQFETE